MKTMKFISLVLHQCKLYGTAKVHKMAENDSVENLPFRPVISNIGIASYHLVKHLPKLLLTLSEFTVKNTKALIQEFKNMLPPDDYKFHLTWNCSSQMYH